MNNNRKEKSRSLPVPQSRQVTVSAAPSSRISALARDALLVIGFSVFVTLCARTGVYLHFPFQSEVAFVDAFGVLLAGGVLGSRRGALAMLVFLGAGAVGLPVFPVYQQITAVIPGFLYFFGGQGGMAHLGTLYFWSYPLAAFAVGWLCERSFKRKFLATMGALAAGALVLTLFALASSIFVSHHEPLDSLLDALSYAPGDALLLILLAGILYLLRK